MHQWKRKGKKYRLYGLNGTQAAIKTVNVETEYRKGNDVVKKTREYFHVSIRFADGTWQRVKNKQGVDFRNINDAKKIAERKLDDVISR